jgi:hypothetical protein
MARSIRIVCTISPRRGVVSNWRDREGKLRREPKPVADAPRGDRKRPVAAE